LKVNCKLLHRRKAELEKHERTGTPRPIANRSETLLRMNTGVVRTAARHGSRLRRGKTRRGQQLALRAASPLIVARSGRALHSPLTRPPRYSDWLAVLHSRLCKCSPTNIEDIHTLAVSEKVGHLAAQLAAHGAGRDVETTTAKLTTRLHEEAACSKKMENI